MGGVTDTDPCTDGHRWRFLDRYDGWYCGQCRRFEHDDDVPEDDDTNLPEPAMAEGETNTQAQAQAPRRGQP